MAEYALSGFAGAAGILAFFGGIALIVWAASRGEAEKRKLEAEKQQLAHAERLRALELGQPLPDAEVARAVADRARARVAGCVGLLLPLGLVGAALATTLQLVEHNPAGSEFAEAGLVVPPLLYAVWGVCGFVSLMTVVLSFATMRARSTPPRLADRPAVRRQPAGNGLTALPAD